MIGLYYTQFDCPQDRASARHVQHKMGRELLRRVLACDLDRVVIRGDGKPFLPHGPYFSLSHSGGMVLLVVCDTASIGCDVEDSSRVLRNSEQICAKISKPESELLSVWGRWTYLEARFKAGLDGIFWFPPLPSPYVGCVVANASETVVPAKAFF